MIKSMTGFGRCETELNGLFTYDRKVFKYNEEPFVEINRRLSHCLD